MERAKYFRDKTFEEARRYIQDKISEACGKFYFDVLIAQDTRLYPWCILIIELDNQGFYITDVAREPHPQFRIRWDI